MAAFFPRIRKPLALLAVGVLAIGLPVAVSHRVFTRSATADAVTVSDALAPEIAAVASGPDLADATATARVLVATDDDEPRLLLPKGITSADGFGGRGVHRAVLKNGVWFPVFSPGDALSPSGSAESAPLAEVPLSITSGTPEPGYVRRPFVFACEAIGGTPPYRWTARVASATPFAMDASSGVFAGQSDVPVATTLDVFVWDAVGAMDSARYPLRILEEQALSIATAVLPAAALDAPFAARLEAIGGAAPYLWSIAGQLPAGVALTPNTGEITGTATEVGAFPLEVTVTDRAGSTFSKKITLTVSGPTLQITAGELPEATVATNYSAQLIGEGGTAPYVWKMVGVAGKGLSLAAETGVLSGTPTNAGEFTIEVRLTDAAGATTTRSFTLVIANGLDITTPTPLFPGSPGLPYELTFTATGGTPPYRWAITEGALPAALTLSPEGVLAGVTGPVEGVARFAIEVRDTQERTFTKTCELPVRRSLLAIPSREKVGLAWQPEQIDRALRASGTALTGLAIVRGATGFPREPGDGVLVYRGTGNNVVDRGLPTGRTVFYTLFVQTADGTVLPYASAAASVLPVTLERARPGVTGDPYADRVTVFAPLTAGGYGAEFVPGNLTGPPDGQGTYAPAYLPDHLASLHARAGAGGAVVVEFTDNIVELGPGMDFTIFENVLFIGGKATARFMEPAVVWVALFDGEWYRFPIDVVPPAGGVPLNIRDPFYYHRGFAGRNGTTGSDPTNPTASGGDSFDANELAVPGLTWIRFIKIQSTGDNAMTDDFGGDPVRHTAETNALSGRASSGFDLDAVSAVNY